MSLKYQTQTDTFKLLRYFSFACGITTLIVAITLGIILNTYQVNKIIHDAERQNISLSRLISNSIKTTLPDYLDTPDLIEPESLRNRQIVKQLDKLLYTITTGLHLLKIKIYNTEGLTLYSSDPTQIGESKATNSGFLHAVNEIDAASRLSFRNEFSAFSGVLFDLDVVETYIAILSDDGRVIGAFELYTDVTHLRTYVKEDMIWLSILIAVIFIIFFSILFIIVKHADRVIKDQYQELEKSRKEIQQRTEELYIQANYDTLTKLANRINMYGQLKHELKFAEKHITTVALLFIDLDGFKQINDALGHDVGDDVLVVIANRLSKCVKEFDSQSRPPDSDVTTTVARLGGDEFTLIIPRLSKSQDLDTLAEKIVSECSQPIEIKNKILNIGASIGIALYPSNGDKPTTLMRYADLAMYQAKNNGKNTFRYFTDELDISGENRLIREEK